MNVIKEDAVTTIMEERGITDSDLNEVINYAEESGEKLFDKEKSNYLAKKRLENFTVYVEYQIENDTCKVLNVYSHRVSLSEDQ